MATLKRNSLLFLVAVFLSGCVSSSYKVDSQDEGRTQILVTRDRVILECYRLTDYAGDIKEAHLFSINVLDEGYNAYSGDQKPCPSDEFPIVK